MKNQDNPIDKVLKHTDIVDLIGEYTPLEKKGKGYMGLCPFHDEKTPSFSVSEEKQVYHCFGCKASGNALTFVKEQKGLSTREAIQYLAKRANVDIDEARFTHKNQKYFDINYEALQFYKVYLNHTKEGETAREYLKKRGLDAETVDTFDLGLAPAKKDALYKAMTNKNILKSDLADLGLVQEKESVFDVFRERIIFPVHDIEGRTLGFSGRLLSKDKQTAKYMNSPKTPTFEKQKILYNIHRAKKAIKEKKRVVLFEGFMDVIMAHKAGVEEGVAVMGTALTAHHADTLSRLSDTVVLCFDGDQAGVDATRRFLKDLRSRRFDVRVAAMPKGKDPDDYIREQGDAKFRALIDEAQSQHEYLYAEWKRRENLKEITGMERFKKQVFSLIRPLSAMEQSHFLKKLSEDLNVSLETLQSDFQGAKPPEVPTYRKAPKIVVTDKFRRAERAFIHYFLKDEYYTRRFRSEFEDVTYIDKAARDIQFELFEYYDFNRQTCLVPQLFTKRLSEAQQEYFEKHIDCDNYPYSDNEFEDLLRVMREYTRRNRIRNLKKRLEEAKSLEEKIRFKEKIDAMYKEAKHGQR